MDELDLELRTRLDALAAAAPVAAWQPELRAGRRWPFGRSVPHPRSQAGRRWSAGLEASALIGMLLVVGSMSAMLLLGGSIEGRLGPIGGTLDGSEGSIDLILPKGGDIACPDSGDDPCMPTPVPTIEPATAVMGNALRVPALSIPVDHAGDYSILVGSASLPNGVLTQADVTLLDNVRPDLELRHDLVRLVIVGEDGEPRGNTWSDGWHPGLEQVEVRLEFKVVSVDVPTTLEFTDIVVR